MVIIDSLEEPGLLFPRHRGYVFVKAANLELEEEVSQLCYAEPEEEKDVLRFQWGRLALSLQRDNAAILGNRIPTFPGMAIDGQP